MAVEKMQFSMPMAAGYEGFPFTATQAEKEEAEAFTVKARAEQEPFTLEVKVKKAKAEEASFVVKAGCGSKSKAEEEAAAVTVKAKAEEAAFTVKAKAEEEVDKVVLGRKGADATTEEVEDSDDDCDSDEEADEDPKTFMARIIADYNAHVEKIRASNPWLKYGDYDPKEYSDNDYYRRKEEEASRGVDGLVLV